MNNGVHVGLPRRGREGGGPGAAIRIPARSRQNAAIFSNCDRLEVFVNGTRQKTLPPQHDQFPNLKHPLFFADMEMDGAGKPELRLDDYVGDKLVLSGSFSSDETQDQLLLHTDDAELAGNGFDATRLVFGRVDKFGSVRLLGDGKVSFQIHGPGTIVGDNPFQLADAGGIAAVWIKGLKMVPAALKLPRPIRPWGRSPQNKRSGQ